MCDYMLLAQSIKVTVGLDQFSSEIPLLADDCTVQDRDVSLVMIAKKNTQKVTSQAL